MALSLESAGKGILLASGPGEAPSVVVSDSNANDSDVISITPMNQASDAKGDFVPYVDSIEDGKSFTVKAREQLPEDLAFNYVIPDTA